MTETVSVIVPVYNAEKTIKRCLASIGNQSYSNIEMIVIDDGSTDETQRRIKEMKDDRIIYVRQVNAGVSSARNAGLELSNGDFVVFVDSDDIIDANLIEHMVKFAQDHDLDMVCCNHMEEYSTIAGGNSNLSTAFAAKTNREVEKHFNDLSVGMAVGKLFRKRVLDEKKIRFPVGINLAEDFCFTMSVLKETNRVGKIDDACYRVINSNPYSLSKRYIPDMQKCIDAQMRIWDQSKIRYPGLDRIYAESDMDYKLHKVKIYANNFYRRGSGVSYFEAISQIKRFISQNPELFIKNQHLSRNTSKIRKLESKVIKTRSAFLIGTMYCIKERIRIIKLKYMWKF